MQPCKEWGLPTSCYDGYEDWCLGAWTSPYRQTQRWKKINAPLNRTILSFWLLLSDCNSGDGPARRLAEQIHFIFFHTVGYILVNMPSKRKKNKRRMRRVVSTLLSRLFLIRVLQSCNFYCIQTDSYLVF